LLLSALIETVFRELRTLIIGKMHNASTLGYYSKGEQIPKLIMTNVDGSIQAVMLPALSAHQEERSRVKSMMRRAIVSSSYVVFPVMIGLAVVAEPMVRLLLTEKWLPAVPFLQVFCFSYMLWPIHTANLQAINALGRSDIFLKLEIIKKILGLVILLISIPMGPYAIAIGGAIGGIMSSFVNAWPNKRLLDYRYLEQIRDILPPLLIAIVMGLAVYSIQFLQLSSIVQLIIQLVVGVSVYVGLCITFKLESYNYLITILKGRRSLISKAKEPNDL
jgi:O-antigen/teichoic acid export membrane protein